MVWLLANAKLATSSLEGYFVSADVLTEFSEVKKTSWEYDG